MTDTTTEAHGTADPDPRIVELGGLHFSASFRGPGATLRVSAPVDGKRTEVLRFDDFIEAPHYHVPAEDHAIMFDRSLGAPLDWYVDQIADHLGELLTQAGYAQIIRDLDLEAVTAGASQVKQAMIDCVPEGYVRVPGVGLQAAS